MAGNPARERWRRGRPSRCSQGSTAVLEFQRDQVQAVDCSGNVQGKKKKRSGEASVYVSSEAQRFMKERGEELRSGLDTKFPSFVKIMMPSHVSGCFWMGLPNAFCRDHMPQVDTTMKLIDEESKAFKSIYLPRKTGLSGGWLGFSKAKGLVEGDALVFQLVDSTSFKVYILRADDVAAAHLQDLMVGYSLSSHTVESKQEQEELPQIATPARGSSDKVLRRRDGDEQEATAVRTRLDPDQSIPELTACINDVQEVDAGVSTASQNLEPSHDSSPSPHREEIPPLNRKPLPEETAATPPAKNVPVCRSEKLQVPSTQKGRTQLESGSLSSDSTCCSDCSRFEHALNRQAGDAEAAAEENARLRFRIVCKVCLENDASTLVLPCRHLCLCGDCESGFHCCPICRSAKVSCVRVFLS